MILLKKYHVATLHNEDNAIRKLSKYTFKDAHGELVNYLSNQRIPENGDNLLIYAMGMKRFEVSRLLLSFSNTNVCYIDNQGYSVLHWAVLFQRMDLVAMITNHCTFNKRMITEETKSHRSLIEQAFQFPFVSSELLSVLLNKAKGIITESMKFDLLHNGCRLGAPSRIRTLLEYCDSDIANCHGRFDKYTPLQRACFFGHANLVSYLWSHPMIYNYIRVFDLYDVPPIWSLITLAARHGHSRVVHILLNQSDVRDLVEQLNETTAKDSLQPFISALSMHSENTARVFLDSLGQFIVPSSPWKKLLSWLFKSCLWTSLTRLAAYIAELMHNLWMSEIGFHVTWIHYWFIWVGIQRI